ncbi:MAG: nucleotidyltransferase family protein [Candidatus Micrarchaeia archaeon]
MHDTRAFVLCGGEGTRLRPYTYTIPKPMLPLGKRPILEFVVENLKANGITNITLTIGYLGECIREHFGNGSRWGVNISYIEEKRPMNTAGSIYPARKEVKDTFVVVMGDHLTTVDLQKMVRWHREKRAVATLGLKRQGMPLEYGIAEVDKHGRITKFQEKPILTNLINAGVYVLEPEVFDFISPGKDFAKDVFPAMLAAGRPVYGYVFDEYWMDIGRIHDYEYLNQIISIIDLVTRGR